MKKKFLTLVGARPQFIKLAALSPHLRQYFNEVIVHTGQHYDKNLSDIFFQDLNIPKPDYNLEVGSDRAINQMSMIMIELQKVIDKENPDGIIVFGDTNSTAAGAVCAAKNAIKLIHVEAGMREFNKQIPEEINKLITTALADFHFCATKQAVKWLKKSGIEKDVYLSGDVMLDLCVKNKHLTGPENKIFKDLPVKPDEYIFATIHRAANTDNLSNLNQIISALKNLNMIVVLPVHPRIKDHLIKLVKAEDTDKIILTDPLPYVSTQALIRNAYAVITDSGGVTKEAYYYKVQAILTDTQTEWTETVKSGWNIQAGPDFNKITEAFMNLKKPNNHRQFYKTGQASENIAKILLHNFSSKP